MVVITI